jgi:uncharacterized protein
MSCRIFCLTLLLCPSAAFALPGQKQENAVPDVAAYAGEYRLDDGGWVTITRMGITKQLAKPLFVDWQTGRFGNIAEGGADRFVAPAPESQWQTEILFSRNDAERVDALTITEKGEPARRARREDPFTEREVTFVNGQVVLSGTLRVPKGAGPFPAVVLVHGSGPGERQQYSVMVSFFNRLGLATLAYDKRGCGDSGGDWKKVDLEDLAGDALAGVRWLQAQPGIDSRKVGLWGISQGGWITPLAAAMEAGVPAFVINSSGPGTSLRRQDTFMMTNTLRFQGMAPEDVDLAIKALNTLYDFGRGRATAEVLDAIMDKVRANPKLKALAIPPAREISAEKLYARQAVGDPAWFFHLDPDRDALAPYRRLRCPILVTYGRLDYTVPVEESVRLITQTLTESGHTDHEVRVLESAGHGFAAMRPDQPTSPVQPTRVAREFFSTIEEWLRAHGFARP